MPTQQSTPQAEPSTPTLPAQQPISAIWFLVLLALGIGLAFYFHKRERNEREKRVRELNDAREFVLLEVKAIEADFPFMFPSMADYGISILCMDRQGERLRFVDFSLLASNVKRIQDLTVPVSSILSVELSGGNEVVTDYETTSTKPDALLGAILGGYLFGQAGAIVGATAAGSDATTVAKQRLIQKPSVLMFELSDLNNPVVRFRSTDPSQCDLWLHRVRSAMAKQRGRWISGQSSTAVDQDKLIGEVGPRPSID